MAAIVLPSAVAPVAILFMAPLSSNINSWATAPMSSRNVRLGLSEVLGAAVAHICLAGDCTIHCLHHGQCTIWKARAARRLCGIEQGLLAGPLPEIKVTQIPRHGVFVIRKGKASARRDGQCPAGTEAEVQVVFYQSRANYIGDDCVSYEVRSGDQVRSYSIRSRSRQVRRHASALTPLICRLRGPHRTPQCARGCRNGF